MFIFGGDTPWTYEQIQRKRALANSLIQNNRTPRNVGEGLGAIGDALLYRSIEKRAAKREDELRKEFNSKFGGLFGETSAPDYAAAISGIESQGRYDAIGPKTSSGDMAYGKYQVMGANIPAWTEKWTGRKMTPQEFLASPEAQEKVFNGQFGEYVSRYGNPQDAASMWFSGRPMAQAGNASDGNMTVPQYIQRFNTAANVQQLIDVMNNPMATPAQKMYMQALLRRAMAPPPGPPKPTATIQEYRFYAQQEKAAGREPMTFSEWKQGPPPGPPKPTATIQEYRFYAQQEKAAGREPMTFSEWKQGPQKPTAYERDTLSLVDAGVPLDDAKKLASGAAKFVRDNITGEVHIIEYPRHNQPSGEAPPVAPVEPPLANDFIGPRWQQQPGSTEPTPTPPPDRRPVDVSSATGPAGAIGSGINTVLDAMGLDAGFEGIRKGTVILNDLRSQTLAALANGVAGRESNYTLGVLMKNVPSPNALTEPAAATLLKLQASRDFMNQLLKQNKEVASSRDTSRKDRADAQRNIIALEALVGKYDKVIGAYNKSGSGKSGRGWWIEDQQ